MQRIQARRMLPLEDMQDDRVRIEHRDRIVRAADVFVTFANNNGEAVDTETTTSCSELP